MGSPDTGVLDESLLERYVAALEPLRPSCSVDDGARGQASDQATTTEPEKP